MSAQDHFDELSLLEAFRVAVWGDKSIFKKEVIGNTRTIEYLDFAEHHRAVQSFCHTAVSNRLAVFEEYRVAMRKFKEEDPLYKNGACIIGQPGIGKSCFIAYAVIERLREEEPVAVQVSWDDGREYLLFTSDAVTIHESGDRSSLEENSPIWAFSDSDDDLRSPIRVFQNPPNIRVFQTTSPAQQRSREWTKYCDVDRYTMDVPSVEEIEDLAFVLGENVKRIKTLAEKWGNVPRTLLRLLSARKREKDLEQSVIDAVDEVIENPRHVFKAITGHDGSKVQGSSTMFFIKSNSKTRLLFPSIYVPTRWLTHQLVDGLYRLQEDKRAEFLRIMSTRSWAYSTLDWIFESVVHRFLAEEGNLTINWRDGKAETLSIPLLQIHTTLDDLNNLDPPYYWYHPRSNFPGIDGAIVTPRRVFVIQAIIRFRHREPTKGLKKFRKKFPANNRKWSRFKILFVGRSDKQAKSVAEGYEGQITQRTRLRVGWLSAPVGGGFEALRHTLETEETTDEETTDEEEDTDDDAMDAMDDDEE